MPTPTGNATRLVLLRGPLLRRRYFLLPLPEQRVLGLAPWSIDFLFLRLPLLASKSLAVQIATDGVATLRCSGAKDVERLRESTRKTGGLLT